MRRDQLEHAIKASCQIIERDEVIVVGSQAILGTFDEKQLPAEATMSLEVDILPISDDENETAEMADQLEGVAGEFSMFEETHGFSIDGVDLKTAKLCALREKDINFVSALLNAGLVDSETLAERLPTVPDRHKANVDRGLAWLRTHR